MSPMKVMPLVLTVITPFVMIAGMARAAETPLILAQFTPPQHKEEEHKQQQKQPPQKQQPPHGQPLRQPPLKQQPQVQQQQRAQQQKAAEEQRKIQELKAKEAAGAQKRAQDAAKLHNDQHKIQQLQQQQHNTGQQLQQAHRQENTLHRQLSATDQKARAARDAHAADRARLIAHQKQIAANERNPAAINERLRLQNERMHAIASQRQQSVDRHGQTLIKEPGNRTILQANGHAFVQHDETANFRAFGGNPQTHRAPNGNMVSTFARPGGVRIEVEVDAYGRPMRRVRYMPDGRRFVLFENRAIAIGAGFALAAFIVALAPPHIGIPPEQYIVDADVASEDDYYAALQAGPVEPLGRGYTLDEILASVDLRNRMRSISIDTINFEFGSADVAPDQAQMLEPVAAVMRDMAKQNPGEVFLIEGHTDAVGSDIDNLSLSDRRAQAIADLLAQQFGIPAENLVTQGYGKQFLLVPTPEPERRNRRVVIRRITPLLQSGPDQSAANGGPGDGPMDGPGGPGGPGDGPMDGPSGPGGPGDGPMDGPGGPGGPGDQQQQQ
ncbi:MAG: OmpA family protein [Rhodomicrobium sp.]